MRDVAAGVGRDRQETNGYGSRSCLVLARGPLTVTAEVGLE